MGQEMQHYGARELDTVPNRATLREKSREERHGPWYTQKGVPRCVQWAMALRQTDIASDTAARQDSENENSTDTAVERLL